ncbi:MAG: lipopolysaccharide biosynthesis protein [Lachnospiraceae bacterium]|nr:lipopolysaccharide biosynthesis protein [Lachnospiraceae bacterium]
MMSTRDAKEKEGNSTVKGFLSYFYGNFVVLILGFAQTPLLTRILSTGEFGKSGMFETAVTVIYIFSIIGLDQAYIRFYYEPDIDRRALLRRCITPSLLILAGLSVIYIVFSDIANGFLFGSGGADVTALVIIYAFISVFERFFFLDVRMQQNGKLYSNINIIEKVLSILTIIAAFLMIGNDFRVGLLSLAIPWGITTTFLVIRYFVRRGSEAKGHTAPSYRALISYGAPFITVLLMEWALSSCDRIALRQFADFEELGIYDSAMKIIVLLLTFKNTFIAYWSPVAMERFESGRDEENKTFFRRAYEYVVFLGILAAAFLILLRRVIVLLLGSSYRSAESVIPFLTLMPVFAIMFEITVQSIKYTKKGRYLNIASLLALISNIAGNIYLVPLLGGLGAAITTGLSYIIYFVTGSYFAEKCINIGYNYKKTAFYAALMIAYCAEAAFVNDVLVDTVCGIVIIACAAICDRDKIAEITGYAKNIIKK